jgi:hypothetical protein
MVNLFSATSAGLLRWGPRLGDSLRWNANDVLLDHLNGGARTV